MSFRALTRSGRRWGLLGGYGLLACWALAGCVGGKDRSPSSGKGAPTVSAVVADAALPGFAPDEAVVLIHSAHDTLGAARLSLEAALRLPIDLPLPFPRIERHSDRFRVVLSRGPFAALSGLWGGVKAAYPAAELLPAGQAGGDDIIRMAIVCSPADSVPLYAAPKEGVQKPGKELARLHTGQVLAHQAGLSAAGADFGQCKGLAGTHGQRQRAAQGQPSQPRIAQVVIHSAPQ